MLKNAGFIPVTLGKRILRTELAPLYLLSTIGYQKELKA
jgi:16S rRNA (uracil1498-N3)-methyltransferase